MLYFAVISQHLENFVISYWLFIGVKREVEDGALGKC